MHCRLLGRFILRMFFGCLFAVILTLASFSRYGDPCDLVVISLVNGGLYDFVGWRFSGPVLSCLLLSTRLISPCLFSFSHSHSPFRTTTLPSSLHSLHHHTTSLLLTTNRHQEPNEHPRTHKLGSSHITSSYVGDRICWMRSRGRHLNLIQR